MHKLAAFAHGEHYQGQTSSATFIEILSLLSRLPLPDKARLLDLGCGNGTFTKQISKELRYETWGIDLSDLLITIAKNGTQTEHPLCHFQVDDFVTLKSLNKKRFDCLLSIGSLYWNQPLKKTLFTWKQHLENDGYLIIFSNLKVEKLSIDEEASIGETKFIEKSNLKEILKKYQFKTHHWEDRTSTYINWLKKWCEGMHHFQAEIYEEMGMKNAERLINRFQTYLKLALEKKVLREIIVIQKEVS